MKLRRDRALGVVAVLLVALWREYGPLWTEPAIYLILLVPSLPALLGRGCSGGHARDRWWCEQ